MRYWNFRQMRRQMALSVRGCVDGKCDVLVHLLWFLRRKIERGELILPRMTSRVVSGFVGVFAEVEGVPWNLGRAGRCGRCLL